MSYQAKGKSEEEKIRILHVDDDPSSLVTSKQILNIINPAFDLDFAHSVDEALNKLSHNKYDVIVSDYEMPHKNGLDLLAELKNNKNSTPRKTPYCTESKRKDFDFLTKTAPTTPEAANRYKTSAKPKKNLKEKHKRN